MIYDHYGQASHYMGLIPGFSRVIDALEPLDLAGEPDGRRELVPGVADLILDRYTPGPDRPVVWETHRKYADLQLMLVGEERLGWLPASAAPPVKTPYDAEHDACFYEPPPKDHPPAPRYLPLTPGMFVLLLPSDVHAPGLCPEPGPALPVTKAVVKIRMVL